MAVVATFLRKWGIEGSSDGEFKFPGDVAVHKATGEVYVGDDVNVRVQKFTTFGIFVLKWFSGFSGGPQIDTNSVGDVYTLETNNDRIQKFTPTGTPLLLWPIPGLPSSPRGLAIDQNTGDVYANENTARVIKKFDASGFFLFEWGGPGGGGNGLFNNVSRMTTDSAGNVFVVDGLDDRIQKFNSSGVFLFQFGSSAIFLNARGIAIDETKGFIYVTDATANKIVVFDLLGSLLGDFGLAGAADGEFNEPTGLSVDAAGDLYVADKFNHRIQVFSVSLVGVPAFNTLNIRTVTQTTVDVRVETDIDSTSYFVILPDGADVPTSLQVQNGEDATSTPVAAGFSDSDSLLAGVENSSGTFIGSGLPSGTNLDMYVVAEGVGGLQSIPTLIKFATLPDLPVPPGIVLSITTGGQLA